MKTAIRTTLLAAVAGAVIGTFGPGISPAQADPSFANILGRIIDHARDRNEWRRDYRRAYRGHQPFYDFFDDHQRNDRRVRRHQNNPYNMETRGLYAPGYNIRGVLNNNYSGHRH